MASESNNLANGRSESSTLQVQESFSDAVDKVITIKIFFCA
jgi:hypothetical protein